MMIHDFVSTFPRLRNAPITEAIIDLRAELPSEISLSDLERFQSGIEDRFSERCNGSRFSSL